MPRVNCAVAGTSTPLIAAPTDGLPNSNWVGSITIQRDELANDDVTPTTGYIYVIFPGRHNSGAGGASAVSATVRDVVLSSAQPSVTIDLGTGESANSFLRLSGVRFTSTVNNEGVTFFTTED